MSGAAGQDSQLADCALCGTATPRAALAEAGWASPEVLGRLVEAHPGWRRADGACPACVQEFLLTTLLERGEAAYHRSVQDAWPIDTEAAFGALPTPLRLHADPRVTGRGVTIAIVDSAFYPHPDLVLPRNRIRAWVDVSTASVEERRFGPQESPRWPGWDGGRDAQWHGLMTSTVAAGNGHLSHGLYRGLAPEADLVLVQARDASGRIGNASIARALAYLLDSGRELGVRVVNLSLGGDPVTPLAGNPVDEAVAALVARGVVVVAAAGNDGVRRLVPPGTAPAAITVGGLDDKSVLDHEERALWRSNYGESALGASKPELVAPSLRVVAPLLPGTPLAREAGALFAGRARGESDVEGPIAEGKLVTPYYQHVEGTSFAAPIVSAVAATMLEVNTELTPRRLRELLLQAAQVIPGAPPERQGAGAIDAGRAVTLARADCHGPAADFAASPQREDGGVRFLLHDHDAGEVRVLGSWDGWKEPGLPAARLEDGVWCARLRPAPESECAYKFRLDGRTWLADPANPARAHDGHGGLNSLLLPG